MVDIHYVKDVPEGTLLVNSTGVLVLRSTFERIGDYTRSQPTAPSPGRIYRKALHWTALNPRDEHYGQDPNWFIYITCDCAGGHDGHTHACIKHLGKKALII